MYLVVDNFAGCGGASVGIEMALGRPVDIAVNHNAAAIATHRLNHPGTHHLCEDVFDVDPAAVCQGRPVGLAWFSPDCKHFSKAKGGKPVDKKVRGLAWVVIRWAAAVHPRVIILENVEEFPTWGPLDKRGNIIKSRKGETFQRWLKHLRSLGYVVEFTELAACDYGAPTTRNRFFLVARCDGLPIVWPEKTHGAGMKPYRTAAECIDWSIPCPSIFERKKPLKENTLRRIAMGIRRYVIESANPFIVTYYGPKGEKFRGRGLDEPLPTQTTENRFGLVVPSIVKNYTGVYGHEINKPLGTVTTVDHHALAAAHIVKCNHQGEGFRGQDVNEPLRTVLASSRGHHALATAFLTKFYGTNIGSDVRFPMPTITSGGQHIGEVQAFLLKYYGTATGATLSDPMHTITTKDRLGLVTVRGEQYQIADIGLRMLQPRELARAQGFPESFQLIGTKTAQVAQIGNSVAPPVARALVEANCGFVRMEAVA